MKTALCICFKIIELIFAVASVIIKKLSDKHSDRVFIANQKFSREWTLLNRITWTSETDDFSALTFVGYTYITAVLLLTRFVRRNANYHTIEILLLSFGILIYIIEGLLIISTWEQLQDNILPYAYTLGALCIFNAILFTIDLMLFKDMSPPMDATAQTDTIALQKATISQITVMPKKSSNCCQSTMTTTKPLQNESNYLRTDL